MAVSTFPISKTWAALCIRRKRKQRGANNSSIIHTRVHPRDTIHDVSLNIGLGLWSQLALNILMLSDLLDLLDHVETVERFYMI